MSNQPGQGAYTAPSRFDLENKRYVFQAYPSTRFHADGRTSTVLSAEDEAARCNPADGWVKTPYPAKPVLPPKPEPTPPELKLMIAALTIENTNLKTEMAEKHRVFDASWAGIVDENKLLKIQCAELLAQVEASRLAAEPAPDATSGARKRKE